MPTSSKVLVIGGGIAGVSTCSGLRKYESNQDVEIILVEPKDHVEMFWAAYRSPFDAKTAEGSLFSLEKFCTKHSIQHLQTTVTQLSTTSATLENGQVIEFDMAVLATGASMPWDGFGRGLTAASKTRQERLEMLKREGNRLLSSETVVIGGGGLVGSELASDLATFSRNANRSVRVILVHSGDYLCHHEMNPKAGKMLQEKMEKLGIRVILNEKLIKNDEGKMVLENSGELIEADQFIMTTGVEPMNSFVDPGFLNDKGWIEVDEYFQVKGAEGKLFAMGDCCTGLPNAGWLLIQNSKTIGWNISAILSARRKKKKPRLTKCSHPADVYICTIGTEDGVASTPMCASACFLPWLKNRTMFLFEPRWQLGLES